MIVLRGAKNFMQNPKSFIMLNLICEMTDYGAVGRGRPDVQLPPSPDPIVHLSARSRLRSK